jgi:hypothetical protein
MSCRLFALLALGVFALGGTLVPVSGGGLVAPEKPTLSTGLLPWTHDTSATFQFSGSAETAGFICRLDSGAAGWVPCTAPVSYSSLSEGSHSFQVRGVDSSGDESPPSSFGWTIDVTAPATPADTVAEATSPSGAIVVFEANDNLDPSPRLDCTRASGGAFPLGITSVTCTATDAAGNVSPSGTFTVTVRDSTAPTLGPHADVVSAQQSPLGAVVNFALPVAHDAADPSPVVQCDSLPGAVFPIGETRVTCTATDNSGLTSRTTTFSVIVQAGAAPAKPGIAANVPHLTNRPDAAFELSVEPGTTAECRLDGPLGLGSFAPCSSGTARSYSGLVDGAYLFTVQVTNAIGNFSQASYAWTVDLPAPAGVVRFRARGGDRMVNRAWTKPIDIDYDRVRIWRKRAGATAWKRVADRVSASSFTDRTVVNHVRYRYRIRSLDKAGNASTTAEALAWPSPIFSPQYDAIVHSPPLVDWKSVRNATYYNMQVWRNGRKLLSVWPLRSRYQLRARWTFRGTQHMLSNGRVTVYVWAGFGPKAAVRYGPLLGRTTFRIG